MNRKTMLVSVMMILALGAGVYGWTSANTANKNISCLLYTSPSPRDSTSSRMPSSA